MQDDLIGFQVFGRHGVLGIVVDVGTAPVVGAAAQLTVRGGVSSGLVYVVPEQRISSVVPEERVLLVDADIADFVPILRPDGTVELRFSGP